MNIINPKLKARKMAYYAGNEFKNNGFVLIFEVQNKYFCVYECPAKILKYGSTIRKYNKAIINIQVRHLNRPQWVNYYN